MRRGYPVVFFHRPTSIRPFAIELGNLPKWLGEYKVGGTSDNKEFASQVAQYQRFNNSTSPYSKLMLQIPFTSVTEYLRDLEVISRTLSILKAKSVTYLAAAVSDFYVPEDQVAEHKIQGISKTGFTLEMQPVPKMMGHIKQYWNPSTLLISFKLETDINILEQKALSAITNYGVDLVVAN